MWKVAHYNSDFNCLFEVKGTRRRLTAEQKAQELAVEFPNEIYMFVWIED